jgi:hypothetical protein
VSTNFTTTAELSLSFWDVYNHTGKPLLCQVLFLASANFILAGSVFSFAKE